MTLRKTTSLTTLISFTLLLITSVVLYITPQGKIAFWANWQMLGLGKEEWGALHTNLGLLFIAAGLVHTVLNWKPIVAYMKNKAQKLKVLTGDFNLALGITLLVTLFTLFELQPVHSIQVFNESLKESAAQKYGEPPYGHAEVSPLRSLCKRMGIDITTAIRKLEQAGLAPVTERSTLSELAASHDVTPQEVYNLIQPDPTNGMPDHPGSGFGRKIFSDICAAYRIDQTIMVNGLKELGIDVDPALSMKENADKNEMDPRGLYETMLQLQ